MIEELYKVLTDRVLFVVCLFILGGSVYISIKTRFIQIRAIPFLWKTLKNSSKKSSKEAGKHTISPLRALFTSMSTTLGISTLVGPVIAIQLGGPGALLGFIITAFLGSAVTYVEVSLSVQYRKKQEDGKVMGGPMQYLHQLFSRKMAKWYAIGCTILMMGWSAAQANQLTSILSSSVLGSFKIPVLYSSIGVVALVMLTLMGGVKRISSLSAKLVPVMFILYIGSSSWIILSNLDQMGSILNTIVSSVFSPYALASGSLVGGVVGALRWGVFKGIQTTEAGVGTQTIPHSLADTSDPRTQGILAMLSTFSAGGLAFLSGCVALITNTWQDPSQSLGMGMVASSYEQYFSWVGVLIITISALLFGLGTILGNAFNGGQCYQYLMENKKNRYYFIFMAVMIFLGAMGEVRTVWSMVDIILAFIAVPHMMVLLITVRRTPQIFAQKMNRLQEGWEA